MTLTTQVRKSELDTREYLHLELPGNGLSVLLISDPATDKSACAVNVAVGHLSDPAEAPGLAHFTEHMLFLGTEKYPDENTYSSYLASHGGYSNAYTDTEDTNYHFQVAPGQLEGALDCFAQFFIAPLFTADSTARELNAVDSEHSKNIQNDTWRMHQLVKSLSKPEHPFHKFGTGNAETLGGEDVRDQLLAFHKRYYSAHSMQLCILGVESIPDLQEMVLRIFADVDSREVEIPDFSDAGMPISPEYLGKAVYVVPIKESKTIKICWQMPSLNARDIQLAKPGQFLSHVIGYEGPGSILALLKTKGWATELGAGPSSVQSASSFFNVYIDLTVLGVEHRFEVVDTVYQYVEALKNSSEEELKRVYDDEAVMRENQFTYKGKEKALQYCTHLARTMRVYPVEDVLCGETLFSKFDFDMLTRFIGLLTRDNSVVFFKGQEFQDPVYNLVFQEEEWYKTLYCVADMQVGESSPNDELHLPKPNPFICTNFTLLNTLAPEEHGDSTTAPLAPRLLLRTKQQQVWYKLDRLFPSPKLSIFCVIETGFIRTCPESEAIAQLYLSLVKEILTEVSYDAEVAELKFSVHIARSNIEIEMHGYSEKLPLLLTELVKRLKNVGESKPQYELIKEKMAKDTRNKALMDPWRHAVAARKHLVEFGNVHYTQRNRVFDTHTDALDWEALERALPAIYRDCRMQFFVHGNITEQDTLTMCEGLRSELMTGDRETEGCSEWGLCDAMRVVQLPQSTTIVQLPLPNPNEENSACLIGFQLGHASDFQSAMVDVFAQLASEPCFDTLRTKQQLGYLVWSFAQNCKYISSFEVLVQSKRHPSYVHSRVTSFLLELRVGFLL